MTQCQSDILAALDSNWRNARTIHERVDCWAFVSIRTQLLELIKVGLVESRAVPYRNTEIHEFRLAERAI